MAKKIFKYTLETTDSQKISLPANPEFLSVQNQNDQIVVYAIVDTNMPERNYNFSVYGTGHQLPDHVGNFIGSTQILNTFVWHIFVE